MRTNRKNHIAKQRAGTEAEVGGTRFPLFDYEKNLLPRLIIVITEYCQLVYIHGCCIINVDI